MWLSDRVLVYGNETEGWILGTIPLAKVGPGDTAVEISMLHPGVQSWMHDNQKCLDSAAEKCVIPGMHHKVY